MKRIKNKKHKMVYMRSKKIFLSCFNEKRLILDDDVHALAYFHKDILV